jgi:hypothetical protein
MVKCLAVFQLRNVSFVTTKYVASPCYPFTCAALRIEYQM